jgi:riboflavin biosynthesis pyrimidine reductase
MSDMEPLEVLFEVDGPPTTDMPADLVELYGGSIGFREPRLYSNFVSTIDGVVAIPSVPRSNTLIADGSDGDRFVMGLLRAFADAVLIGAGTLASSPNGTWLPEKVYPPAGDAFAELRRRLGRRERPEIAVLTGHGSVAPEHPLFASGAVVLTSDAGATRLEGELPEASTVVTLGEETVIDPRLAVEALLERGHRTILCEAGPHTHGSLLACGLVDELFLTISPFLAGDRGHMSRYGLAEAADLMPPGLRGQLVSVRRHEEHLFLRYRLEAGVRLQPDPGLGFPNTLTPGSG